MGFSESFKKHLFQINEDNFEKYALDLFIYQYSSNAIYRSFVDLLGVDPKRITKLQEIPFLPIEFWKKQPVYTGKWDPEKTFLSSGTTHTNRSKNPVRELNFYDNVSTRIFESFYGNLKDMEILAVLPSYQEQGNSSLIHMVDHFMRKAKPTSSYYNQDTSDVLIERLESDSKQKILIGVSYALLDLIEYKRIHPINTIIIETGGMKGRKIEMVRWELHEIFKKGFDVDEIHSEYGMTELMSQAYSRGNQTFTAPPWMQVFIRDINDPFECLRNDRTGGINIIDLANVDTCAFIETQDLGKKARNGTFQVLGRFDNSEVRGCNLLVHQ